MENIDVMVTLSKMRFEDLDANHRKMINEAINQLDNAYAPYSNFHVGAAVLLENGKIHGGSNQENASYPLCMCAERVALYHSAIASPSEVITSLAITARNLYHKILNPVMPCGACRQVILEYEQRQKSKIKIYLRTDDDLIFIADSAAILLPFGFDASFLK
jgi:cytidine deaminase